MNRWYFRPLFGWLLLLIYKLAGSFIVGMFVMPVKVLGSIRFLKA
jgi:hypothetical protein